jgi:hypothetical protein
MKKVAVSSILIAAILLAGAVIAEAQQPGKVARIGYLIVPVLSSDTSARIEVLRQGLRELGYVEGKKAGSKILMACDLMSWCHTSVRY